MLWSPLRVINYKILSEQHYRPYLKSLLRFERKSDVDLSIIPEFYMLSSMRAEPNNGIISGHLSTVFSDPASSNATRSISTEALTFRSLDIQSQRIRLEPLCYVTIGLRNVTS